MEFINVKFDYVEAKREKDGPSQGLAVKINTDDVRIEGDGVEFHFTYRVEYSPNVGSLILKGRATAKISEEEKERINERWEKEKKLPEEIAQNLINLLNYAAGTNGVLVAKAINLAPPMVPPRIKLKA